MSELGSPRRRLVLELTFDQQATLAAAARVSARHWAEFAGRATGPEAAQLQKYADGLAETYEKLVAATVARVNRTGDEMRTDQEIDEQLNKAADAEDSGQSSWPGMTYEQGVAWALRWVRGHEPTGPMDA